MADIHKVVILGSGNVAFHLGKYFLKKGMVISQVFSRNKITANQLAKKLNTIADTGLENIVRKADAYFLCVNDDSIKELSMQLSNYLNHDKIIIHCSGSRSLEELDAYFLNRAVIWPLQSFGEQVKLDWEEIPFFIEATDSIKEDILHFCKNLNWKHYLIDSDKKKLIHIAAVFANNFTNFNYIIAHKILGKVNVPFDVLRTILDSGLKNAFHNLPENTQTGPAKRADSKVLQTQTKELSQKFPEYKDIYKAYSQLIMDEFNKKKVLS